MTQQQPPAVPQGWYPDPSDQRQLRWWDGQQWTQYTAPGQQPAVPPAGGLAPGMYHQIDGGVQQQGAASAGIPIWTEDHSTGKGTGGKKIVFIVVAVAVVALVIVGIWFFATRVATKSVTPAGNGQIGQGQEQEQPGTDTGPREAVEGLLAASKSNDVTAAKRYLTDDLAAQVGGGAELTPGSSTSSYAYECQDPEQASGTATVTCDISVQASLNGATFTGSGPWHFTVVDEDGWKVSDIDTSDWVTDSSTTDSGGITEDDLGSGSADEQLQELQQQLDDAQQRYEDLQQGAQ